MNNKIKIVLILVSIFIGNTYGQVVTTLASSVYVNNQTTVPSCGLIDFGNTVNNSLSFSYKLTQPFTQTTPPPGNLTIYLKGNSSQSGSSRGFVGITSGSWSLNTSNVWESSGTIQCNISNTEVQLTGSSIYIEYTPQSNQNDKSPSCEFTIKKNQIPTFNLSPTAISIPCGSTSPVTFSISNVYNSPGTLSYVWSRSGWSGIANTTMSSVTLTPISATSLPSSVSVTPYLNGVAQPTKTCTVTRTPFTSTPVTIVGANSICTPASTGVYSIANLPAGNSFFWSSSNTAIATITSSGLNATVNRVSNGTFNLIARITNSCGQNIDVVKSIRIGGAPVFTLKLTSDSNYVNINLVGVNNTNIALQGITSTTWTEIASTNGGEAAGSGFEGFGLGPNNNWTSTLVVTATNDCGTTSITRTITPAPPLPCSGSNIANRPSSNNSYTSIIINPCRGTAGSPLSDNQIDFAALYDLNGIKIKEFKTNNYDLSDVKKGIYIIKVITKEETVTTKINVE